MIAECVGSLEFMMGPKQMPPWYQYLSFHSPPTVTASMSCGASRSKVRKLVYEEHTEYVALEVNLSKSG